MTTFPTKDGHGIVRLWVERDSAGLSKGVMIRCECGWQSGPHFSSMSAQATHIHHVEEGGWREPTEEEKDEFGL